jgi:hypothetical protein
MVRNFQCAHAEACEQFIREYERSQSLAADSRVPTRRREIVAWREARASALDHREVLRARGTCRLHDPPFVRLEHRHHLPTAPAP